MVNADSNIFAGISDLKKARVPYFGYDCEEVLDDETLTKQGWGLLYNCILGVPKKQAHLNIVTRIKKWKEATTAFKVINEWMKQLVMNQTKETFSKYKTLMR